MRASSTVSTLVCMSLLLLGGRGAAARQASQTRTQAPSQAQAAGGAAKLGRQAEKIRRVVEKAKIGGRLTVVHKDGKDYHGAVSGIGEDAFQLAEVDLHQLMTFRYEEVRKVRTGYGNKNIFGRRPDPKKSAIVFGAVMAGIFTLIALSIPKT